VPLHASSHIPVSVVIPARNEAHRIASCLRSLQNVDGVDEIIVVDDESADETPSIAFDFGATVIAGAPLPVGWIGKPWALHQGLTAARNDIVVCLDADTVPRPGLIAALVEQLKTYDLVSLSPRFLTSSMSEQALHAAMLTGLVYRFGAVGTAVNAPEHIYGNGQCLAFRRDWLLREGGLQLAARHMNDDVALLRALASRGARIAFLDGRELLDVRMHESAAEVWREWGRSLPMNDVATRVRQVSDLVSLWLVLVIPVARMATRRVSRVDVACLVMRFGMTRALAPSYEGSRKGVYLSPLFDIAATTRLTQATCLPVREWRDRRYTHSEIAGG
jgi:dolichol-phosphate mannosyltransferase